MHNPSGGGLGIYDSACLERVVSLESREKES